MLVEEVMTAPIIGVGPTATVHEAARLMIAGRFGGLPVVKEDGTLVGMVSESDFLRRSVDQTERKSPWWLDWFTSTGKCADEYFEIYGRTVEEVMSPNVATIRKDDTVDHAVDVMVNRRVKRLPVVEGDKVVGIVARADLLRGISRALPADKRGASEDERIRHEIEAELSKRTGVRFVRARVESGVAHLGGIIFDESSRSTASDAAKKVGGVKSIQDELVWVEPMSNRVILPEGIR